MRQVGSSLVIMDAEGAECELLRPDLIPELSGCRILVELHDFILPGVGSDIATRFDATHEIRRYKARVRCFEDLPIRSFFLDRSLLKLTREFRPASMEWFDLRPRFC